MHRFLCNHLRLLVNFRLFEQVSPIVATSFAAEFTHVNLKAGTRSVLCTDASSYITLVDIESALAVWCEGCIGLICAVHTICWNVIGSGCSCYALQRRVNELFPVGRGRGCAAQPWCPGATRTHTVDEGAAHPESATHINLVLSAGFRSGLKRCGLTKSPWPSLTSCETIGARHERVFWPTLATWRALRSALICLRQSSAPSGYSCGHQTICGSGSPAQHPV